MTIYVKDSTGEVIEPHEMRREQSPNSMKNQSLWEADYLEAKGYYILNEASLPTHNSWDNVTPKAPSKEGNTWTIGWNVTSPSLIQAKEMKRVEINRARDVELAGNTNSTVTTLLGEVPVNWQVDTKSINNLVKAITLFSAIGGAPEGTSWRSADNVSAAAMSIG